jgi:hypothetical protein
MLKSEYIQLVKDGTNNRFKDRTIAVHLSLIFEQLFGQLYTNSPEQIDQYTTDFTIPVTRNGKVAYIIFPKQVVHFKDLKKGCRSINTTGDSTVQFVPVSLLGRKIYPTINTGDTSIGFEVKTDRAIFDNLPDEIKDVSASLVVPFSQHELTDNVPAPSGVNELIIQFAIDSLNGKDIPVNIHKSPVRATPQQ